jgi:hypothetical protein
MRGPGIAAHGKCGRFVSQIAGYGAKQCRAEFGVGDG